MNIPSFRQRAPQILLLVILVQVSVVILVYITKSWPNINLFSYAEHEQKVVMEQNIFQISEKSNNLTLNLFTKQLPVNDVNKLVNLNNLTLNLFTKQLPVNDINKLVNLTDFDYKIKKANLCNNEMVLLFVAVSSAPGNQLKRQVIRETWGSQDDEVKIVFMLGDTNNPKETETIRIENMAFNDIVQGNFIDSYKNMTYKSTMALKYAIYNCPTAKFLMKCDDDILINMPLLKNFLKNDMRIIDARNSIFCTVNEAFTPIRDSVGELRKWYVSYEEWPEEKFPMYCSGWHFIVKMDVAFDIYQHAQNSTFFWIDDVFLTGIAAKNVHGLKYVNTYKLTLRDTDIVKIINGDLDDVIFLVGSMNMAPEHIRKLWQYILSKPVQETVLDSLFKITNRK